VNLTGGRTYFYSDFAARLHVDISRTLTGHYYWNSILRIKLGAGLIMRRMHGNGVLKDRNVIAMPALSPSETYGFELEIEPPVPADGIAIQFVLEWTDDARRKMIRLFTFGFPVSDAPEAILATVDVGALTAILAKRILQNMIGNGTAVAAARFAAEAACFGNLRALREFAFAVLRSEFLTRGSPEEVERKVVQILQLRVAGIVDALLFCYPRVVAVADGSLRLLNSASFGEEMLVIHMIDAVYVWALTEEMLLDELGPALSPDGIINIDMLEGPNADALRGIVKGAWELSLCYLIVLPLFGEDAVRPFLVEETRGDVPLFSIWATEGRFAVEEPAPA
jgi:hypothetical protein